MFGLDSKKYNQSYELASSKQRHTFEERIHSLDNFINARHRFPFLSGGDEESSLRRWIYNVTHSLIEASNSQKEISHNLVQKYSCYPQSADEYSFYQRCYFIKQFVLSKHRFPQKDIAEEKSDYYWIYSNYSVSKQYQGNRERYYNDLLSFLIHMVLKYFKIISKKLRLL